MLTGKVFFQIEMRGEMIPSIINTRGMVVIGKCFGNKFLAICFANHLNTIKMLRACFFDWRLNEEPSQTSYTTVIKYFWFTRRLIDHYNCQTYCHGSNEFKIINPFFYLSTSPIHCLYLLVYYLVKPIDIIIKDYNKSILRLTDFVKMGVTQIHKKDLTGNRLITVLRL